MKNYKLQRTLIIILLTVVLTAVGFLIGWLFGGMKGGIDIGACALAGSVFALLEAVSPKVDS